MSLKNIIDTSSNQLVDAAGNTLVSHIDNNFVMSSDTFVSNNDILRIKDGTDDEWFLVDSAISGSNTYEVWRDMGNAYTANTLPAWKKGTSFVNYKQNADGGIYMTASETYAPYIDILTHDGTPWNGITTKVRLGNLSGITDSLYGTLSGYGLYSDNVYLKGSLYAPTIKTAIEGRRIELVDEGLFMYDADGIKKFAMYIEGSSGDQDTGDLVIGDVSSENYIKWDESVGTLFVRGSLNADDIEVGVMDANRIAANSITAYHIAANSITASELKGTDFGTLTISSGKIAINTTDALEIQAGGSVKCIAGSDIQMIGHNSNPSTITFFGDSYNTVFRANASGKSFYIVPVTTGETSLTLGGGGLNRFVSIALGSTSSTQINAGAYRMDITASGYIICTAITIFSSFHKGTDLGSSGTAFDDVFADDFTNVADFLYMDNRKENGEIISIDDIEVIKEIKPSNEYNELTGLLLIDDDTLPDWLVVKHKKDGEVTKVIQCESVDKEQNRIPEKTEVVSTYKKGDIARDPDGKPYLSLKTMISLCMGAIKQLDNKIEELKNGV